MGLQAGDHFVVVMRNRYEMATLYWASPSARPHLHAGELARQRRRDPILPRGRRSRRAWRSTVPRVPPPRRPRLRSRSIRAASSSSPTARAMAGRSPSCSTARAGRRALRASNEFSTCLMLYTSGTTGRPKGVPRSHRNELTASISHIAQNQYRQGDSCLGVMPFFHTMGVRILLGSALLNGRLVCMPELFARRGLAPGLSGAADDALSGPDHVP